ncbi:Echinocandin B biosynthetic cluster transcription factor ecdB [Hyphodiscus hymeniophilus]|uniref:Echinocandin B biosynthetic cluster transcription factor ecdB n=1 Tax=Hyphodiscus hymeniophilus TaxID=353542 RepID=A0A9P7AYD3_9HELO|nr:Echinocandin B biosynthetic cluster transcription factor ecdB [Hyphodiscus hymeniophilus]
MSSSSAEGSPASVTRGGRHQFSMSRDKFHIDIPENHMTLITNGNGHLNGNLTSPSPLKSPNGRRIAGFSREGILGSAQKARKLSQSSGDRESMTNGIQNRQTSDDGINPLKRRSTDAGIDYPRRRATIACEICRSRKSRCDGIKPKCKLCTELGAECIYREPGIKLDAGDKLILEHLTRIEGLLQSNLVGQTSNLALSTESPSVNGGTTISNDEVMMQNGNNFVSMIPATGLGTWTTPTNISTMPKIHTNAALHLLQWPLIRDLVSRPYDPQILLQLEMAREPLALSKTPCLDLSNTSAYIEAFFSKVNVWYACVNPFNWQSHYRVALSNGFRDGPESCIVLLVLALGQASCSGSISRAVSTDDPPGLPYFAAAWGLLPGLMTRNSVLSAQCTVLASAYLFYLVRPLEAWTLLSSTSTKLQLLLSAPGRVPASQRELSERVYWNALLFESDLLAELDLPHSGIVQYEEVVGLPGGFEEEGEEGVGRDELWYFLAEIALRRLLNRVSQLIYSKDSMASTQSLEPVVAELDFQLTQWYESLPLALQFPYSRALLSDPVQTVLRLRYFACRTIIFRPYILAVLDNEQTAMDPSVRENCRKCLEASIRQLEHITAHHAGHIPYLWQGALSIVSQTLLLMGATMSPSLSNILGNLVPHLDTVDAIINDVVMEVERYSHLAPSLALSAEIIREAEMRRRSFLGGMSGMGGS